MDYVIHTMASGCIVLSVFALGVATGLRMARTASGTRMRTVRVSWASGGWAEYTGPCAWLVAGLWRALAIVSGGVVT
jgi:hypothetical protein